MNVFTKIALASTGMVEIKRNQAGFILYIQGRANPPKLERFVTFWSFPRWSNILHPLTGGRRNRLTICQIRYKETNSETVTLSSEHHHWAAINWTWRLAPTEGVARFNQLHEIVKQTQ